MFIELREVTKYYGKFKAVDSLSFNVEEGDVYGFLGPNGSGKSTSIRMLLSLIKPSSGTIKLFDKEITFQKNDQIRRIGALIETPDFYQYLSAKRNLKTAEIPGDEPPSKWERIPIRPTDGIFYNLISNRPWYKQVCSGLILAIAAAAVIIAIIGLFITHQEETLVTLSVLVTLGTVYAAGMGVKLLIEWAWSG